MFNLRNTIAILALVLLVSGPDAAAQVGIETTLWAWTQASSHHDAIVNVTLDGGSGTGIIIAVDRDKPVSDGFQGYCLTAYHVVEPDHNRRAIRVTYNNGRTANRCRIEKFDAPLDVAILWVWVPPSIQPARLAASAARFGDALEFVGLGGANDPSSGLRFFLAKASAPTDASLIYADVSLLPGDSGGPVFNQLQEVVGVISGGWFWWDGGVVTGSGNPISATWPARAANLDVIQRLANEIQK